MSNTTESISRCINIDWLEVSVLEPVATPHDANYFRSCGWTVHERDYGTRVWGEMFTLEGSDGYSFLEVRRNPKSEIIAFNVAHLRFVNRVCYFPNAAELMTQFMQQYNYEFQRISRIDICLDFERFDYGDLPRDFMRRYIENKYSKINQADVSAHGSDRWEGRVWNSVSWGSPHSDIGTKFYNKTLELYDPVTKQYGKPYIRQAWQAAGLIDDHFRVIKKKADGTTYTPEIWRVEFSIRSSVQKWFTIELNGKRKAKQSIRNTLEMYDSREKLLILFASLSEHYFHFKHLIKRYDFYKDGHSSGNPVRKDRCPDKLLFRWRSLTTIYKVEKQCVATSARPEHSFLTLLSRLKEFRDRTVEPSIKKSATMIIDYLEHRIQRDEVPSSLTKEDIEVLQAVTRWRKDAPGIDPAVLMKIAREELRLRDEIDPFFSYSGI